MELKLTSQFKKDLKRYQRNPKKIKALETVLRYLRDTGTIPAAYKPHELTGDYKDCMECHVQNDFLLIWFDKEKPIIKLMRLGSHSELF